MNPFFFPFQVWDSQDLQRELQNETKNCRRKNRVTENRLQKTLVANNIFNILEHLTYLEAELDNREVPSPTKPPKLQPRSGALICR